MLIILIEWIANEYRDKTSTRNFSLLMTTQTFKLKFSTTCEGKNIKPKRDSKIIVLK